MKSAVDWFTELNRKLNESEKQRIIAAGGTYYEPVDGSNANGLDYVPFDGYISELHAGEAVLTAQENRVWQQFKANGYQPQTGVTAAELRDMLASMVNGLNTAGGTRSIRVEVPLSINGKEFSRAVLEDLRAVEKSTPEVKDD